MQALNGSTPCLGITISTLWDRSTSGQAVTGGTTDYADLTNKPSINSIELSGNKTLADLGITNYNDTQVKADIADLKADKQ